jgi:hypothetical protein
MKIRNVAKREIITGLNFFQLRLRSAGVLSIKKAINPPIKIAIAAIAKEITLKRNQISIRPYPIQTNSKMKRICQSLFQLEKASCLARITDLRGL